MKQKLLKTWLMLVLLLVGVGTSWAEEVTFDFTTNSFSASSTSLVKWTSDHVVVTLNRGTSSSYANNYLGGTTNNHTRVYNGQLLSFVAKEGYFISKVEVTSTSSSNNIPSTGWINATASASGAVVTANANSNVDCVEVPITATKQITSVKVTYSKDNTKNNRTITIRANNVSGLTTTYGAYDWTAGLVSGKTYAYKGTNSIQFNSTPYLYNTTAIPGKIKSIKMVAASGAAARDWSVYVASEQLTNSNYSTKGTKVGSTQSVSTSGNTWDITSGNYSYFCLYKGSSATQISEITVTYTPEGGDTPSKTTPSLSFDKSTYNVSLGDDFTAPTLTNTNNVPVTYSASDVTPEGCIEVTENGSVTINGAGSATITASYDGSGSDTYNSSSASYKLVVAAPVQKYTISYATTENGTIVVKNGETVLTEGAEVAEGTTLTIECTPTDADNYKFKNWQYKEGDGSWNTRYTNPQDYTMPSANVQFRANFELIPTYTIAWSVNGVIVKTDENVKQGAALTAPEVSAINGKNFTGWVTTPTVDADATPAYATPATPNTAEPAEITYYAVFAVGDGEGTPSLTKITDVSQVEAGIYAIISYEQSYYLSNSKSTNTASLSTVTKNEDVITIKNDMMWTLGINDDGSYTLKSNASTEEEMLYLWGAPTNDGIRIVTSSTKSNPFNTWELKSTNDYGLVLCHKIDNTTYRYLSTYGTQDWRNYTSTGTTNLAANIYKYSSGSSYSDFTTMPAVLINAQVTSGEDKAFNTTGETAVILNRNFNANAYNTLVLPFSMTADKIADVFGSDARVYNYTGTTAATENTVTLNFSEAQTITANTPVFIYGATNAENKLIEGVTIVDAERPTITDTNGAFDYVGVYAISTVAAGDIYINKDNQLKTSANGTTKLQPTRAYFKKVGTAEVRAFSINDEETGIVIVENGNVNLYNGEAYNLAGQKVSGKGMKAGIYVIGGRKVVVK